jgi:hypothetical protein
MLKILLILSKIGRRLIFLEYATCVVVHFFFYVKYVKCAVFAIV